MACSHVEGASTFSEDLSHLFTVSAAIPPIYNFMNLDSDFVAFRKFKRLHLYSLLYQQRELASLDKKLEDLDSRRSLNDESTTEKRMQILPKLAPLLKKYDDMLFRQDQIMRMTKTPKQLVKTLRFHSEVSCKQLGAELYSGGGWDDLVPLGRIQQRWFERLLNSSRILQKWFKKPPVEGQPDTVKLYSEQWVRMVQKLLINLAFCIMVIVPIFILSYLTSVAVKLLVITAAFLVTSVIASMLCDTIEHASLAVIAGYTAILVVFLGNNPG